MLLLTGRDLQHRAARFGAVIAGVSVVFTVLLLMTGLNEQFHLEPRKTVDSFGADLWLVHDGNSGAFTSGATMPAATADLVEGARGWPVVFARHSMSHGAGPVDIEVVGYRAGGLGEPTLVDGRLPTTPDEVVLDDASEVAIGETVVISDERFVVTGYTDQITLFAGMPFVFMDLTAAQDLLYRGQDVATTVLVAGTPSALPTGFVTLEPDVVAADATRPLAKSISSVNLIRVLLWMVAAMIIGTMTYLSALERRRDVAVLKAVGAPTHRLGASIALQAALVAGVGAIVASGLQVLVVPVFPLEVAVPTRAFLQVPVVAVLVALVAGAGGLRSAVKTDPALAFSGMGV